MRTISVEGAAAALIAAAALAGCGSDRDSPGSESASRSAVSVDEREGTYRGVGIGSTRDEARRELGRLESGATDPLAPIATDGLDVGVPPSPHDPRPSRGIAIWRFEDAVMAAGRGRAWLVTVIAEDAVTREGVGVGSALDDVRRVPGRRLRQGERGHRIHGSSSTARCAWRPSGICGSHTIRCGSVTMSREPLR